MIDSETRKIIALHMDLQRRCEKNRIIENIDLYRSLFNLITVPNNGEIQNFKSNFCFYNSRTKEEILYHAGDDYFDIAIPLESILADDFDDFIYGKKTLVEMIQLSCMSYNINIDLFTFTNVYESWNNYQKRISYDEHNLLTLPENASISQSLQNKHVVWCYNKSCSGKTFLGISQLKRFKNRVVYNPCFSHSCDYELLKVLLCLGRNVSILIDDIQCDIEKAKELYNYIYNHLYEFSDRNVYIFLISWSSLLSDKAFAKYKSFFPTYSPNIEMYVELLKNQISNEDISSACGNNIALLHSAVRIKSTPHQNSKENLFKIFVKTDDPEKIKQIYRLCVLGTYEYSVSKSFLGAPNISPRDLNTLKVFDTSYYAGHREICQFIAVHIESLALPDMPRRDEIIRDYILSIDNSEKWKAVKQLIGETGAEELKAISPIWNALHCFEQEISIQTEKDPAWGDTPSSMFFVLKVASLLGVMDDYTNVLEAFCQKFDVVASDVVELKFDQITTTHDFEKIKQKMIEEDKKCQNIPFETGDAFETSVAHKNWCLGLIVGLKDELIKNGHQELYAAAVKDLFKSQTSSGYWYPRRIPWVTARIVIGLTQAGYTVADHHIKKAIDYFWDMLADKSYWEAHTGGWNSIYETSALCLEAIYKSGFKMDKNGKIDRVIKYLMENQTDWMVTGKEVDGSATACCLAKIGRVDQRLLQYINSLCEGCIYEIVQENAHLDLETQQSCKITQIAWYTTDFCWHIFGVNLPVLLEQFVSRSIQNEINEEVDKVCSVFISYSEDSPVYVKRIRKISDRLKNEGYNVYFYADEPLGTNIVAFMQNAVNCDVILVMGTKKYREKALEIAKGGVFFENLICSSLFLNRHYDKIVPIAFDEFAESFPPPLDTNKGARCKRVDNTFLNSLVESINIKLGGK